jgi:hypothetical protein
MPRLNLGAAFTMEEIKEIDRICHQEGILKADGTSNYYVFLRKAAKQFCEECKEKKQDERKGDTGQQIQQTDQDDRNSERNDERDAAGNRGSKEAVAAIEREITDPLNIGV